MSREASVEIGAILGDATKIYFTSLPRVAPVALLSHAPVMIADVYDALRTHDPGEDPLGTGGRVSMFLGSVALAVTTAYVVPPVMSALGHREAPTLAQVGSRVGAALGTAWITNLIVGLGLLCFLVPGVLASLWYCVAIPAAVAEGMGAGRAMERSKALTEGHRATALALNLAYGALLVVVIVASTAPLVVVGMDAEATGRHVDDALNVVLTVLPTVLQALLVAFGSALFTVFYVRLRQAKDGIDADALAEVFA